MDNDNVKDVPGDDDDTLQRSTTRRHERMYCGFTDCHKSFTRKFHLQRHIKNCHLSAKSSKSSSKYPCEDCHSLFASKSILKQHREHMHGVESEHQNKNFSCSECSMAFHNRSSIIRHYMEVHSELKLHEEKLTFAGWDDFSKWKQDVEKRTLSSYVKGSGSVSRKCRTIHCFICHRSGNPVLRSPGKQSRKSLGSKKTGNYCPARIYATESDGVLHVDYFSTHIGHQNEANRLGKQQKEVIDGQLHEGVPVKRSLHDGGQSEILQSEIEETKKVWMSLMPVIDNCTSVEQLQSIGNQLNEIRRFMGNTKRRRKSPKLPQDISVAHRQRNGVPQRRRYVVKNCVKKTDVKEMIIT